MRRNLYSSYGKINVKPLKVKSNQPLIAITYFETKLVEFVVIVVESCFRNSL